MAGKKQKLCNFGHAMRGKNVYKRKDGGRQCRLCGIRRAQEARDKKKAEAGV